MHRRRRRRGLDSDGWRAVIARCTASDVAVTATITAFPGKTTAALIVTTDMDDEEYLPSPSARTRDQVALYESSGGTEGTTMRGMPVVVLTMRGAKTGKIRKVALMRVEHEGRYAAVASMGGAPQNPVWYHNLTANPELELQDGPQRIRMRARELSGSEREIWWERSVAAYPDYADYQQNTSRVIPVFVLEPVQG